MTMTNAESHGRNRWVLWVLLGIMGTLALATLLVGIRW